MSFYDELLHQTQSGRDYLLSAPIIADVFDGNFTLDTYIAFLNQAYHHVRHTVPLLMAAGAGLAPRQEWLRKTIHEYIAEEFGHEAWILDDLAACGCDRDEFENGAPPFETEVMVAYLYDFIARRNPVGIFGMVLVLEGTSSELAPTVAGIVQQKLALPDAAITYLTTHGDLDQDHIVYFERVMDRIDDPGDQAAVIHVANAVYRLYGDVYRAIPQAAQSIRKQRAA